MKCYYCVRDTTFRKQKAGEVYVLSDEFIKHLEFNIRKNNAIYNNARPNAKQIDCGVEYYFINIPENHTEKDLLYICLKHGITLKCS